MKLIPARNCRHDNGFTLLRWRNSEIPGMWVCNLNCGYFMNFDPFAYPHGVAYTSGPKEEKLGPTLTAEGRIKSDL
jgi:hypothetical protein